MQVDKSISLFHLSIYHHDRDLYPHFDYLSYLARFNCVRVNIGPQRVLGRISAASPARVVHHGPLGPHFVLAHRRRPPSV